MEKYIITNGTHSNREKISAIVAALASILFLTISLALVTVYWQNRGISTVSLGSSALIEQNNDNQTRLLEFAGVTLIITVSLMVVAIRMFIKTRRAK